MRARRRRAITVAFCNTVSYRRTVGVERDAEFG